MVGQLIENKELKRSWAQFVHVHFMQNLLLCIIYQMFVVGIMSTCGAGGGLNKVDACLEMAYYSAYFGTD